MASEDHSESAAATSPQKLPRLAQPQSGLRTASTSTPLEMASLPSNNTMREAPSSGEKQFTGPAETANPGSNADGRSRTEENPQGSSPELQSAPTIADTTTRITRLQSTAIGPSSDEPIPVPKDVDNTGPTLMITLLLINGARHPFKLDAKYLNRRNVEVQGNDPFNLSIYQLKELILREWREEWESKPSSPSSIRLIYFGKLLDDKAALRGSKFNHDTPNVVHMTVKPQDMLDEEEAAAKGGKSGSRTEDDEERSSGCRCVIL